MVAKREMGYDWHPAHPQSCSSPTKDNVQEDGRYAVGKSSIKRFLSIFLAVVYLHQPEPNRSSHARLASCSHTATQVPRRPPGVYFFFIYKGILPRMNVTCKHGWLAGGLLQGTLGFPGKLAIRWWHILETRRQHGIIIDQDGYA